MKDDRALNISRALQRHATGVDLYDNLFQLYMDAYEAGRQEVIDRVRYAIEPYPGEVKR